MAEIHDKVTRFAADLVDAAAAEGARQSRSAKQQLDHWVRLGRAVAAPESAARSRIEAALEARLSMRELTAEEGVVFNAEVNVALETNLLSTHYGHALAAEGITTVALDEDGQLRQYEPDGTNYLLPAAR